MKGNIIMKEKIMAVDKSFDEAMFYTKADHIFIMILDSLRDRDMSIVRHYLSDEMYEKFNSLVQEYINEKKIRLFDEMNIKETYIKDVEITDDKINIEVILTSRYMDYFVDEDGNYISGINDHRIEKQHRMLFTKRRDAKELGSARRCVNCGATLDINHTGLCPYCKNTTDMSEYDYIVTKMEKIV